MKIIASIFVFCLMNIAKVLIKLGEVGGIHMCWGFFSEREVPKEIQQNNIFVDKYTKLK